MRRKTRLSYITIAALFALTGIFIGMHMTGVKDSSAHTQLIINQKQSPKYSEFSLGRDRDKIYRVISALAGSSQERTQKSIGFVTAQVYPEVSSSVSPRGPPV